MSLALDVKRGVHLFVGAASFGSGVAIVLSRRFPHGGGAISLVSALLFCLAAVRSSTWIVKVVFGALGGLGILAGAHWMIRGAP